MERILARLERSLGRFTLENLTLVLIGTQTAALVLSLSKPAFANMLVLDPDAVRAGQYWRLFTFLFLPPSFSLIWAFFGLYWLYLIGTQLEGHWGAFRYQIFWLLGTVITASGAMLFDVPADNRYLLMSLFLAFATLWPDYQILVMFILPLRVKWLAVLDAVLLVWAIASADGFAKVMPLLAVSNYLLFFGGSLLNLARGRGLAEPRVQRRREVPAPVTSVPNVRRCAVCGVTSTDDPDMDFRVCSCAKHEGPTEMCITHARDH
jgi:hypothetical protein